MTTLIDELIERQAIAALQGYRGILSYAGEIVRNHWLPDENEPEIQAHLATLQAYLTSEGKPEEDLSLLRLALTAPGRQRGIVPPALVLIPSRGGFPVRRQREAASHVSSCRNILALGRQFFPALSTDTPAALTELETLVGSSSALSSLQWLERVAALAPEDASQLADRAVQLLGSAEPELQEIGAQFLVRLACFRPQPLSKAVCFLILFMRNAQAVHPVVFRDSGEDVAQELISQLSADDEPAAPSAVLLALAWTRSDAAVEAFGQWEREPPAWAEQLHVPPTDYLPEAGWCLESEGARRELFSPVCFRLALRDEPSSSAVICRAPLKQRCPCCQQALVRLFDFGKLDEAHFRGVLAEAPRQIVGCLSCARFDVVYMAYRPDGTTQWLAPLEQRSADSDEAFSINVRIPVPMSPFACAKPFELSDASTLGGLPSWLQAAAYPRCLECGRWMIFLAQHDNGELGEEGIYYAFFCAACHVAAVTYQQT